jgi:hypothetical protein
MGRRALKRLTRSLLKENRQTYPTCGSKQRCTKSQAEVYAEPEEDCDGDGWLNGSAEEPVDNCPLKYNEKQFDHDQDGLGDACDGDDDGDGKLDGDDNCPKHDNFDQGDSDQDGVGGVCDRCKRTPSGDKADGYGCAPGQKQDREVE